MASDDWTELANVLSAGIVARGASGGFTPPNGGGTAVYVAHCLDGTVTGAVGSYCNLANYGPLASGGSIRACVKRLSSAANTGFSPFLYILAGGTDVADNAYLLGLEDRDPYRIVLRKGSILGGIPEATDGEYLRRSSDEYQISDDLWHHIRLDALVEPTGDVVLNVYESDLSTHACTAPSWSAITGMAQFVDDVAGVNSGSLPYTSGYAGFASAHQEQISARVAWDHIQLLRQT